MGSHEQGMDIERMIRALLIAGPTASGKSAVALALAKRSGGDDRQRQFDAGLSRLARAHGAPERGRGARGAASAVRRDRRRGEFLRRALARARQGHPRRGARPIRSAAVRRRHRPLFSRADARALRHSARARSGARRAFAPRPRACRRRTCTPASPIAIPSPPRGCARATGSACCARSKSSPRPGVRSPHFKAPREAPALAAGEWARPVPCARARRPATHASRRGSRRCCARARSRKSRALTRRGLDPALPVMRAHGVPHLIAHLARRAVARRGRRARRARHPPLRQAAIHLGAPSNAGFRLGRARRPPKRRRAARSASADAAAAINLFHAREKDAARKALARRRPRRASRASARKSPSTTAATTSEDAPTISDAEYDALRRRYSALEEAFPALADARIR